MLICREEGEIMSDSLNPTLDAEQLMFGAIPGQAALGRGPAVDGDYSRMESSVADVVASVLAISAVNRWCHRVFGLICDAGRNLPVTSTCTNHQKERATSHG